ncbi:MAG: DNA polymerase IV, partial [Erysipelotrichaceae bacterium]
ENEQQIRQILGKYAYTVIQNVRGNGNAKLEYNHTIQSISQSTTMDHDVEDYQEIKHVFQRLANQLSARCIKHDMKGQLISISIRYFDFTNVVRSTTVEHYTNDPQALLESALLLFDQNDQGEQPIRHLGISLGSLKSSRHVVEQMNMFTKLPAKLDLLQTLNNQLKGGKLVFASQIVKGEEHAD